MSIKKAFTREEVISIIDNLLQHSDAVMDAITNENPQKDPEDLLNMTLSGMGEALQQAHETVQGPEPYEKGKGISTKHTSQCLRKAADDEPIFVLRGKDPTSPAIIRAWAAHNDDLQPEEKITGALDLAFEMEEWYKIYVKD